MAGCLRDSRKPVCRCGDRELNKSGGWLSAEMFELAKGAGRSRCRVVPVERAVYENAEPEQDSGG